MKRKNKLYTRLLSSILTICMIVTYIMPNAFAIEIVPDNTESPVFTKILLDVTDGVPSLVVNTGSGHTGKSNVYAILCNSSDVVNLAPASPHDIDLSQKPVYYPAITFKATDIAAEENENVELTPLYTYTPKVNGYNTDGGAWNIESPTSQSGAHALPFGDALWQYEYYAFGYNGNGVADKDGFLDEAVGGTAPSSSWSLVAWTPSAGFEKKIELANAITLDDTGNPIVDYAISAEPTQDFDEHTYTGSASNLTATVTVTNTGSNEATSLTAALADTTSSAFEITEGLATSLASGASDTITIKLKDAKLDADTYEDTLNIAGDNSLSASVSLSATINKAKLDPPVLGEVTNTTATASDGKVAVTAVTGATGYAYFKGENKPGADESGTAISISNNAFENLANGKYYFRATGDTNHDASDWAGPKYVNSVYTVTFDANTGSGDAPAETIVTTDGSASATLAANSLPDQGSMNAPVGKNLFDGWSLSSGADGAGGDKITIDLTITGNTTLYARWKSQSTNGMTVTRKSGESGAVQYGDEFTVTVTPDANGGAVTFNESGTSNCEIVGSYTQNGSESVDVTFRATTYTGNATVSFQQEAAADDSVVAGTKTASVTLAPRKVTLDATKVTVSDKVYDAADTAEVSGTLTITNKADGDDSAISLTGTLTGAFANVDAANGKTVTIGGYALDGNKKAYYTLVGVDAPTKTAAITPRPVTISSTEDAKTEYGTAYTFSADHFEAQANTTNAGLAGGHTISNLSLTACAGAPVATSDVGEHTITGFTSGNANYTVTPATDCKVNVTAKTLTISLPTITKVYDGNTNVTTALQASNLNGVVNSDQLTVAWAEGVAYDSAKAADSISITKSGNDFVTLSGSKAGNYSLTQPGSVTGAITAKEVTFGVSKTAFGTTVGAAVDVASGNTIAVTGGIDGNLTLGTDYTLKYEVTDADTTGIIKQELSGSTTSAPTNTGTATVQVTATLNGDAATNYAFSGSSTTATEDIAIEVSTGVFTVAFNANGGQGDMSAMTNQAIGSTATLTENAFTRDGYVFKGWAYETDAAAATVSDEAALNTLTLNDGASITNGATVTLYAVWAKTYTLTVNAGTGGTASDNPAGGPYEAGTVVNISATAAAGYAFGTWSTEDGGTFGSASTATTTYTMPAANATVTASFTPNALTWAYGTPNTATVATNFTSAAPTVQSGPDAVDGVYAFDTDDANTALLAEYGLALNKSTGVISGKPKKAGSPSIVVKATGKNGHQTDVTLALTIGAVDLTITGQTAISKNTDEVKSLKLSDFIAAAAPLADGDTIASLFNDAVTPDGSGAFTAKSVTVMLYSDASRTTPLTALPTTEGTYYFTVAAAAANGQPNTNYNLLKLDNTDGILTVTKKSTSSGGGGGTPSYKVSFDAGDNGKIVKGNASVSVNDGSKLTEAKLPTVEPKEGYKFLGWSIDGKTVVDPTTDKVTKAVTYIALYGPALTDKHIAYIKGYDGNVFRPDANITRAEMATIIARVLDEDIEVGGSGETSFSDVSSSEWYAAAIAKMEAKGIMNGYADGTFQPNANISREELAAVVARMNGVVAAAEMPFTDVKADAWSADSIYTVYKNGWVSGYADGTFRPSASITRAETVRIMNGMLGRSITADSIRDAEYNTFSDISTMHWAYFDVIEASNAHDYSKTDDLEVWTK